MSKIFSVVLLAAIAAGCGVRSETYVMTKDRVGIDYQGGNAGYLAGKPQFQAPVKKTRKIYIWELNIVKPNNLINA